MFVILEYFTKKKLQENNVITTETLEFLNQYRRYRNRITHVYKQPSTDEIIAFILDNMKKINGVVDFMAETYKKL